MESNNMCNICKGKTEAIGQTQEKVWVTSDGHAVHACIHLHICLQCGHIQKYVDDVFQELIKNIYASYQVNLLGGSADQMSFQNNGSCSSRSNVLVQRIKQKNALNNTGNMLDVGCATGLFLEAFHKEFPNWDLYGQEYDSHFKNNVLKINGVKGFYTKDDKIENNINCICMNHVLEHVMAPVDILNSHHNLLDYSGFHFVQVPTYLKDPFELCILDHTSHFTPNTLNYLGKKCGYTIICTTETWTQKHIGWFAKKCAPSTHIYKENIELLKASVQSRIEWLDQLPNFILKYKKERELGIFGTAPASSWVAESLNNNNSFFVDEDLNRQGSKLMGKMIIAPSDIPHKSCIFLPFAPKQAKNIRKRLQEQYAQIDFFYFNKELFR